MRAARVHAVGSLTGIVIDDIPAPVAGDGQVLVKVKTAALNPVDYKVALTGHRGSREFPLTLGFDAVGTVEAIGSGVSSVVVGDRVCLMTDIMAPGTAAEYVAVREHNLAVVPEAVEDGQAAGLPLAGLTALQALDLGGLEAGQSLLVHGGAGGVGHLAIQLAKARGATVCATASARHLDLLAELGADHPIDYHATPSGRFASEVDVVLDTQGGAIAEATLAAMRPGSVHVSIAGFSPAAGGRDDVRIETMLVEPRTLELGSLVGMVASGALRVVVDNCTPLDEFVSAILELYVGHSAGKRLIAIA
jgi:NADPH:quinone reductase-like Zn-dependent oxidoreductase